MPWVKQNLGLVIGGVVALIALGFAGYFTKLQMDKDASITVALEAKRSEVQGLFNRTTAPNQENIQAVKKEQQRIDNELLQPLRSKFTSYPIPTQMSLSDFKEVLEGEVSLLNRQARFTGINLPSVDQGTYGFSFDDIRPKIDLEDGALKPLTFQLFQVKELCQVLFDAKVYGINAIMRMPVSNNDSPGGGAGDILGTMTSSTSSSSSSTSNYLEGESVTDQDLGIISYPYQVSFECGSAELSRVLSGFSHAEHFFRVKWVSVEETGTTTSGGAMGFGKSLEARYGLLGGGGAASADPYAGMANRYGGGGGGMFGGGMAAGGGGRLEDLDEHVLTVNMFLVGVATGHADLEAITRDLENQLASASDDDKYDLEQQLESLKADPESRLQELRMAQLEAVAPMPVEDDDSDGGGAYPY
ncbi:MAG: hypothetical protein EBU26_14130 [Verrucomicrobia bacterium]|nr:hypothetical protein [Verrucomicrobiota bacterium]